MSRAQRERNAKAYWGSLTLEQEAWVLRKMGLHRMGLQTEQRIGRRFAGVFDPGRRVPR